jgi:hypothetical protein
MKISEMIDNLMEGLLYDIFYSDGTMDSNTRLGKPLKGVKYAKNTNGDGHTMVVVGGKWVEQKKK